MKLRAVHLMAWMFTATWAAPAAAIGVNDMVAWSAPGKPLRMDIGLTDLGAARASDIRVQVASAADHARLGLTRPDWADSTTFRILSVDGKVVARGTSGQAVEGDAVSFLVDIEALGEGRLQQVASSLSSAARPLVSASAATAAPPKPRPAPAPARVVAPAPIIDAPRPVVEKPVQKPAVVPAAKPAPVAAPAATPAPAPAPVAAVTAAPIVVAPDTQAAVSPSLDPAMAGAEAGEVGGGHDSLEAIAQERSLVQLQLQDAQALVTQFEQRLKELDDRQAVLEGKQPEPAADAPAAEPETVAADAPATESSSGGVAPYDAFTHVMLALIVLILVAVFGIGHLRDKRRK